MTGKGKTGKGPTLNMKDWSSLKESASGYLDEFSGKHNKANILVLGKTGVGKSSLINAVFRGNMAEVGEGRPVTQKIQEISKEGIPLHILDSKGLEVADYEKIKEDLLNEVRGRRGEEDDNYVHLAWLCLQQSGARIEPAELEIAHELKKLEVSVIVVLTKCRSFKDTEFVKEVREQFDGVVEDVLLTRAVKEPRYDEDENIVGTAPVRGIDELIKASYEIIPESQKQAFANALNIKNTAARIKKKEEARKVINVAAATAGTVAATPIPFSDAIAIVPIQVGMLIKVSAIFGMSVSKASIKPALLALVGTAGVTLAGRTIVSSLLKIVPGVGTVVGGAISATTASMLTKKLGDAYLTAIGIFLDHDIDLDFEPVLKQLKKQF